MHHGNRRAPVALTRKPPVTQAELGYTVAHALAFAKRDGGVDGFRPGRLGLPVEGQGPMDLFGLGRDKSLATIFGLHVITSERNEGRDHIQPVFPREIEVALVMRRAAENRAGAVVHQDEVGDIDRQLPRGIERMPTGQAGVEAQLLGLFDGLLGRAAHARLGAEGGNVGLCASSSLASGWSGEMPTKDAPSSVSGRVV
jgi:hypothetical protein